MKKKLDKSKYPDVLKAIEGGKSVRKACETYNVALSTFLERVDGEQYARARDAQADAHFAEMADLEQRCLDGALDAHAFRAAMDARKWRLARMRPKVYGDKQAVEHSGSIGVLTQEQIDAIYRAEKLRGDKE